MERKRIANNYYTSPQRFNSKERKISNDPEGRVRTLSREKDNFDFQNGMHRKVESNINILDEFRPNDEGSATDYMDKEVSSIANETIYSFSLISKDQAKELINKVNNANYGYSSKRKWTQDEVQLLDYAVNTH